MVEDVEVGSGTSSTNRSAKNLSALVDMVENAEFVSGVMGVIMKQSKNHLPRSQTDL